MDCEHQPPALIERVVAEAIWHARLSRQLGSRRDADVLARAALAAIERAKEMCEGQDD